jgi:hypothetical protein
MLGRLPLIDIFQNITNLSTRIVYLKYIYLLADEYKETHLPLEVFIKSHYIFKNKNNVWDVMKAY